MSGGNTPDPGAASPGPSRRRPGPERAGQGGGDRRRSGAPDGKEPAARTAGAPADRIPNTSARLLALGRQATARVYRASGRRLPGAGRRSRLTGRAAVLALVLFTLVVALAYPTRQYLEQRAAIAEQRRAAEEARKRVKELREEKARWQDPDYVRAEARRRLHFVMPGEVGYVLLDPDTAVDVRRSSAPTDTGGSADHSLWDLWAGSGTDTADRTGYPAGRRP